MGTPAKRISQLVFWSRNTQNTDRTRRLAEKELREKFGIELHWDKDYYGGYTSLQPSKFKEW